MTPPAEKPEARRRVPIAGQRLLVAILIALSVAAAIWIAAPQMTGGGLDRTAVIERARTWTDIGVPYNQLTYKDGYRMDCSGFVSMAWNLPENLTTWRIPLVAEKISKEDLRAGDVLLDHTSDNRHMVIFEKWADEERTAYVGLECTGQEGVMGSVRRTLPYPYRINPDQYEPYRYTSMERYWQETPEANRQPVKGYEGPLEPPDSAE